MIDINKIISDFNVLSNPQDKSGIIYFDSACMSLKPNVVVEAMDQYYFNFPACAGRSSHRLADIVTNKIKATRQIVARFINASSENEIIFTRNTTEGINLLANSLDFKKGDIVLITDKEHNSNLVPWLVLRDKIGIVVKIIPSNADGTFNLDNLSQIVVGAKLVSVVHTSNLDGVTNPVKEIIEIAHKSKALVMLDVAQSIPHRKIDVKDLDVDFLVFSGHKILGPTGTGVFYGKFKLLEELSSFIVGGETVEYSTYDDYRILPSPEKFEAGLQDYAGIIGLGEAIKYLTAVGFDNILGHELALNAYITQELSKISSINIIGPADPALRSGIISFYIKNFDMHQIALMLNDMAGIAVRSGQHCVHSWFNANNIKNSARASLYFYNTIEEAEIFINNLNKIVRIL
ncbi:MAG: cysteine desulfurase [Candidatus Falkowbacteria bacterium]|nr:cysteine desulfurase [Candidatus Falkowbacteria bacterium]